MPNKSNQNNIDKSFKLERMSPIIKLLYSSGVIIAFYEMYILFTSSEYKISEISLYFKVILYKPIILFVIAIGIIVIIRLIYSFLEYGELETIPEAIVLRSISTKSIIEILYLIISVTLIPLTVYVVVSSFVFSVIGLYCKILYLR